MNELLYLKDKTDNMTIDDLSAYLYNNCRNPSEFRQKLNNIVRNAKKKLGEYSQSAIKQNKNNPVWHNRQAEVQSLDKLLSFQYTLNDEKYSCQYMDDSDLITLCVNITQNTQTPIGAFFSGENSIISDVKNLLDDVYYKKCLIHCNKDYILKYESLLREQIQAKNKKLEEENKLLKTPEAISQRDSLITELKFNHLEQTKAANQKIADVTLEASLKIKQLEEIIQGLQEERIREIKQLNADFLHSKKQFEELKSQYAEEITYLKRQNTKQALIISNINSQIQPEKEALFSKDSFFYNQNNDKSIVLEEHALMCPITLGIMEDPVVAYDGFCYERKAIEHHIELARKRRRELKSPVTNEPFKNQVLYPCYPMKGLINDYNLKHKPTLPSEIVSTTNTFDNSNSMTNISSSLYKLKSKPTLACETVSTNDFKNSLENGMNNIKPFSISAPDMPTEFEVKSENVQTEVRSRSSKRLSH